MTVVEKAPLPGGHTCVSVVMSEAGTRPGMHNNRIQVVQNWLALGNNILHRICYTMYMYM